MAILEDVKTTLRISGTALDGEINDLISAAKSDLILSGVTSAKANDTTDSLIKRAVTVYCKANFGWDNQEAERLQSSYDSLKMHLSMSAEYSYHTVTFTVDDGTNPIDEATVEFNGEVKLTDSTGSAVFYVRTGSNYKYQVMEDGYKTSEGNFDVSGNKTMNVSLETS